MKNIIVNQKTVTTLFTLTILIFAAAIIAVPVQAQLSHGGFDNPEKDLEGYPDLNPLPAGVTPDYTIVTVAYLSFRPTTVGLNQPVLVNMWTSPGMYHAFYMCDYTVEVEKPDGTSYTVGPMNSYMGDATAWFEFTPDQIGTWRLKFSQPGTYLPAGVYDDRPGPPGGFFDVGNYTLYTSTYYTPSETDWQELEVIDGIVYPYPNEAMPDDYWTRPVSPQHRPWSFQMGHYPWSGVYYYSFPPEHLTYSSNYKWTAYVTAPNTAHIVWKEQQDLAGLIDAERGYDYMSGSVSNPDIIFMGRAYGTYTNKMGTTIWRCFDIRTGEVYWEREPMTTITQGFFGPSVSTLTPTVVTNYGSDTLLAVSGNRLYKWDPWTGEIALNVTALDASQSGGGGFFGGGGMILNPDPYCLSVQNLGGGEYRLINWTTEGSTSNFAERIVSNITWPMSSLGNVDFDTGITATCNWASPPGPQWCIGHDMMAVDLYTGDVLWTDRTNDTIEENVQSPSTFVADRGKCAFGAHGRHWTAYDLETGLIEWVSEEFAYPWGAWVPYATASYSFNETKGAIITSSYEGVYAIDWDDGSILWHYTDNNAVPFENPYITEEGHAATPFFTGLQIADGKVYIANTEHTPTSPIARDWKLHCIDANTGEGIWKISIPSGVGAIADGYCTVASSSTGYMYVFGKGESETTVSAPDVAIPAGNTMMIKGTVLDMSPAQSGTPCVSAASMQTQMEYIHLQFPMDGIWHNETVTGVPVVLTAIRSDGQVTDIGTTMSDGYFGTFGHAWTPTEPGTYQIVASFNGDDSYGSSAAATTVYVGSATSPGSQMADPAFNTGTPGTTESMGQAFISSEVAIVGAVLIITIIGIASYWTLRKRQ